jgi:hypothetical protein
MAANDTTLGDSHVEIPGRATFWRTVGLPPIRIDLPLESEMRVGFGVFLSYLVVSVFGGMLVIAGIWILASGASVTVTLSALGAVLLGVFALIGAGSYFVDLARKGPHLIMDAEGIRDRRVLHSKLRWSEIDEAICQSGKFTDYSALSIRARRPILANRNPLRLSGLIHIVRRRPDVLFIPLDGFRNNRFLGETALAMVRRHGGIARHASQWKARSSASGA